MLLDFLLPSLFFFLGASLSAFYFDRKMTSLKAAFATQREAESFEQQQLDEGADSFVDQLQREREYHERRYADLQSTHKQMREQFKAVALEEFQHQSRELQHQNKEQLQLILAPLKQRLEQLDSAVSRNSLAGEKNKVFMEEISRNLMERADKIGADAVELARALRGNSKLQGDWGEMILESILSYAGLTKGQEYEMQPSFSNARGEQLRPDLVIRYPQGQRLILDSKVSLTAYTRFVNAEHENDRQLYLKQHLTSVRNHIKELSSKNYPGVVPDAFNYVLLFVPNEGAYIEALQAAPELLEESQRQNVLLTSPTNLIMSIKLCYYLWQRDRQSKNLEQIVSECTDIYHKFVAFMGFFVQIDKSLDRAKEKYDEAYRLLASGRGNITRRLDQLRHLGVTTSKSLPESVIGDAERAEEAFDMNDNAGTPITPQPTSSTSRNVVATSVSPEPQSQEEMNAPLPAAQPRTMVTRSSSPVQRAAAPIAQKEEKPLPESDPDDDFYDDDEDDDFYDDDDDEMTMEYDDVDPIEFDIESPRQPQTAQGSVAAATESQPEARTETAAERIRRLRREEALAANRARREAAVASPEPAFDEKPAEEIETPVEDEPASMAYDDDDAKLEDFAAERERRARLESIIADRKRRSAEEEAEGRLRHERREGRFAAIDRRFGSRQGSGSPMTGSVLRNTAEAPVRSGGYSFRREAVMEEAERRYHPEAMDEEAEVRSPRPKRPVRPF